MSISEQVKELRRISDCYYGEISSYAGMISKAADTIESLSAKLEDMERPADGCGGWIRCKKDNLPDKEVLCCDQCGEMILGYVSEDEESRTGFCAENDNVCMYNCVKWMEKPKP